MDVIEKTISYISSCIHMDKYEYISGDYSRTFLWNKYRLLSVHAYYYADKNNRFFVHTR